MTAPGRPPRPTVDPEFAALLPPATQEVVGRSPVRSTQFRVLSDITFSNAGSGSVLLDFTNRDGTAGAQTLGGGESYQFEKELTGLTATLLTPGAAYDLVTNFQIDALDGAAAPGCTLEVHTDIAERFDFVGGGDIGPVTLGDDTTVTTLSSRGDLGGLTAGTGSAADELRFNNLTGPVQGLAHIRVLIADGGVSDVTVSGGIDVLIAASAGDIVFESDPDGPATPADVRIGPGGLTGPLTYGNQRPTVLRLDGASRVTSVTDPDGNTTETVFDGNGRPASRTDARGTWLFSYTADGRMLSATTPAGLTRTFTYDGSGRMLTDTTTDTAGQVLNQTTYTRDAGGQLLTAGNAYDGEAYTYDADGRVLTETYAGGWGLTFGYDAAGNVTSVQDSAGGETASTYDTQNRLVCRTFTAPGQDTLRVTFAYDAAGRLQTVTRYGDTAETDLLGTTTYAYDPAGNLSLLQQLDPAGAVLAEYAYGYDAAGRVVTETRDGSADAAYSYDALGQVLSDGSRAYAYDANGNRTDSGFVTGPGNVLLSDGTWAYTYDATGNVTGKADPATGESWDYRYNTVGQVLHAEHRDGSGTPVLTADYRYDPAGRLVGKDVWTPAGGTQTSRYVYAAGQLYAETDAAGAVTARYFAGADSAHPLGAADAAGHRTLALADGLGRVRDAVGPAGAVGHVDYDAFGRVVGGDPAVTARFGWSGLAYDPETGLYRGSLARVYDPAAGRWTSPDPLGYQGGDANFYRYAGNRTTADQDPSGLKVRIGSVTLYGPWEAEASMDPRVTAQAYGQIAREAFQTVVTAAGTFLARYVDLWQAGVNTVTWLTDEAGRQLLVLGNQVVDATLEASKRFAHQLLQYGQSFDTFLAKLEQFCGSVQLAKSILWAVVQDPSVVLGRLGASVGKGVQDFFNGLKDTLKDALLDWVTAGVGNLPPAPASWTNAADVGPWLLDFFRLNWDGVRGVLVEKLGTENVALVSEALEVLQEQVRTGQTAEVFKFLEKEGQNLTADALVKLAVDAGVKYVTETVVPKIVLEVGLKFTAGPAALTSLYHGIVWIKDNLEAFGRLAELAGTVIADADAVVRGDPAASTRLAGNVTRIMNGMIPVGLSFAVSQVRMGNVPSDVRNIIEEVRGIPLKLLGNAVEKLKTAILGQPGREANGPNANQYRNLVGKPLEFTVLGQKHRLWVVNENGKAVVMRASEAAPLYLERDLPKSGVSAADWAKIQELLTAVTTQGNLQIQRMKAAQDAARAVEAARKARQPAPAADPNAALLGQGVQPLTGSEEALNTKLISDGATCYFGQACFAAGTPLRTPAGWRAVEDVRVGDLILSRSEHDPAGPVEPKAVEELFRRTAEVWQLRVGGRTIETSGEHPFYARERGWVACNELRPGDTLLAEDGGWLAVVEVGPTGRWAAVYNLRVADHHTYFVGTEEWGFAVWAHNACFDVGLYASLPSDANFPRHHVPQVRAGKYTWGDDYDPNEAPAIIIPLWMHQQVDHLTGLEFEQHQNADIVVHIRYHLKQLLDFNVPRSKVAELKRLIEATLDVHIGPLPK